MIEGESEPVGEGLVDRDETARRGVATTDRVGEVFEESPVDHGHDTHPRVASGFAVCAELGQRRCRQLQAGLLGQLPEGGLGQILIHFDEAAGECQHAPEGVAATFHERHHRTVPSHREDGRVDCERDLRELEVATGHHLTLGLVSSTCSSGVRPYSIRTIRMQVEQAAKPPSVVEEVEDRGPTRFDRFAALVVLTTFGVTWPVLELLGENAEFFLARRSPKGEIVALALISTLVLPVVVGLLGVLPGRFGRWLAAGLIAVTAMSLARLYLARLPTPVWLTVTVAFGIGILATVAFFRFVRVRQATRYLLPAQLILLALFLFMMPVGAVLSEPDTAVGNPVPVSNPTPVMMIVYDEFPVASIIDPDGNLREDRYPNLARLAADGIWFRNAMTVEQQTEHSVPAMLTGSVPDQSLTPVTGQYPFNLFTALRSSHDLHVYEAITQLCPRRLCEGLTGSASSLARDVGVVAGHVLLPEPLTRDLPPIDRGWGDFQMVVGDFDAREAFSEVLRAGQRTPIDSVLGDISEGVGDRPPLYYLHAILPHHPWHYLPDGRSYPFVVALNPASADGGWNGDEFLVAQSMQRHLLQVGYADFVLGEVIAALEEQGIYDESLLIVVADHGITIKPGVDHQRTITETTVGEVAAIPLFVKPPHAEGGAVDDRRALTIDILPTIADVMDADLPGDIDGLSLLGPAPDRRETTTFGPEGAVTYGVDGHEKLEVARRIEQWFPGGDPWSLRPPGSPDLVGHQIDVDTLPASTFSGAMREPRLYDSIDLSREVIPSRVGAVLDGDVDGTEVVAVAINGVIGAVTRSYVYEGEVAVLAMVPPRFFADGANRIDLIEITDSGELRLISGAG